MYEIVAYANKASPAPTGSIGFFANESNEKANIFFSLSEGVESFFLFDYRVLDEWS